jgi:hypothetical protein
VKNDYRLPEDAATVGVPPVGCPLWPERVAPLREFLADKPYRSWDAMSRWASQRGMPNSLLRHHLAWLEMAGLAECVDVVRGECRWRERRR